MCLQKFQRTTLSTMRYRCGIQDKDLGQRSQQTCESEQQLGKNAQGQQTDNRTGVGQKLEEY